MKKWSKLQKQLYLIIDNRLDFKIQLSKYRMKSQYGSTDLPRYWITLGNEIIFDYPKQFVNHSLKNSCTKNLSNKRHKFYPYENDISDISNLIREYIDTPKEEIFEKYFENDYWELIDILKSADKRIGIRRLETLEKRTKNKATHKIIQSRLNLS